MSELDTRSRSFDGVAAPSATLVDLLRRRVAEGADRTLYTFLGDGPQSTRQSLSRGELERRAERIAVRLRRAGLSGGDRVLLLFPPGLAFVAAFFGCLRAGVVAVPAHLPRRRTLARLAAVVLDARPALVLTEPVALRRLRSLVDRDPELRRLRWLASDGGEGTPAEDDPLVTPEIDGDTLAFLQYTSGSTADPKGVMVTHRDLLLNEGMIQKAFAQGKDTVVVGWLPLYHDMGLIGSLLQPLYSGGRAVLMSPMAFLRRPLTWLETISRERADTSGGPDFAYDLCVRRVTAEQRADLDLATWRVAFNGAEPVHWGTLERFAETFAACGFDAAAFVPCYGLAEATLLVSARGVDAAPRSLWAAAEELEHHRLVVRSKADGETEDSRTSRRLTSSGFPAPELEVRIVDPGESRLVDAFEVGEIWVAGESIAAGYWERSTATTETFGARLAAGGGPYLRTGDLGFLHHGELFVTGRLKDLVIIRGENHYPQDLERTAWSSHRALSTHGSAAFSVELEDAERLVLACEIERGAGSGMDDLAAAVQAALAQGHGVRVHELVALRTGTLPRTSSGKVRRFEARRRYLAGELSVVGRWVLSGLGEAEATSRTVAEESLDLGDLLSLDPEDRHEALLAYLEQRAAQTLDTPEATVERRRSLTAHGLDSLAALELQHAFEVQLGLAPSMADLLSDHDLETLAERWLHRIEALQPPESTPAAREKAPAAAPWGPAGPGQEALFFLHHLAPESSAYHLCSAVRILSAFDVAALDRALGVLQERHPVLRSTFEARQGVAPRQHVVEAVVPLEIVDVAGPEALACQLREASRRPFDLGAAPPVRFQLCRCAEGPPVLLLVLHHIVMDFWSLGVFLKELAAVYAAECAEAGSGKRAAGPPPLPWSAVVERQRRILEEEIGGRLAAFWEGQLPGTLPHLDLPTDRPRSAVSKHLGGRRSRCWAPPLARRVKAFGRRRGATFFTVLLAAYQAFLHRLVGQEDVVVGTPTAGRGTPDLTGVVGYLVNPVALRADLAGDPKVEEHLSRTRRRVLDVLDHQDYPFSYLVERLHPERSGGRMPIFQTLLVLQRSPAVDLPELAAVAQGIPGTRLRLGPLELETVELEARPEAFELTLSLAETPAGLEASFGYDAELFDGTTIARWLDDFGQLLAAMVDSPERRLSALPMLGAARRHQVLVAWGEGGPAGRVDACLDELFVEQARRSPDAVALETAGEVWTYRRLERRSAAWAGALVRCGVVAEERVGICLGRRAEMVVAMLAVLRAGAAYVPLDPRYPEDRLRIMLEDSGARWVLSARPWSDRLPGGGTEVIPVDTLPREPKGWAPEERRPERSLAYVIYTSGSTGRPKGVAIEHRSAVTLLRWAARTYEREVLEGVLAATSICFDLSIFELFLPLAAGARVILAEDALALANHPAASGVTLVNTVPSAITELAHLGAIPPTVRVINLAGEPLERVLVDRLCALPGEPRVLNLYGPSEDTTYSTWASMVGGAADRPAIGRPVSGTRARVLDRHANPVPVGVPGELFLGGLGLARGYLARPELTAARFLPDPYTGSPGERLYRTGDLVRFRFEGSLDFLGRRDHQVKVRGFRIELGEVEAALLQHPQVLESAVQVAGAGEVAGPWLAAWVGVDGETPPPPAALRDHLASHLPAFMVPSRFVVMDRLPRTANGKLDRQRLPDPREGMGGTDGGGARRMRTASEELVAEVWSEILGHPPSGPDASFFESGGHSLLALRLTSRLSRILDLEVPLRLLFQAPTVASLATAVDGLRDHDTAALGDLEVPPRGKVLPLSFAQQRLWFLDRLSPGGAAYNMPAVVEIQGALDEVALAAAFDQIRRRHEILRTVYASTAGEPRQTVRGTEARPLPRVDLAGLTAEMGREEADRLAVREARWPFDLTGGPVLRATLLRLAPGEHRLFLTLHHIAADGWSLGILERELAALYGGFRDHRTALPSLRLQYADFALWQRRRLTGDLLAAHLRFWRQRLAGAVSTLRLPLDHPRGETPGDRGGRWPVRWSEERREALEALGRRRGATLFMTVLSVWKALLGHFAEQGEVCVGTPVAGRDRLELEELVGLFANTLVLRTEFTSETPFQELLDRVREGFLAAQDYREMPYERLVEALHPERRTSIHPLFQVFFQLEHGTAPAPATFPGLETAARATETDRVKFDLTLDLRRSSGGLEGRLEYRRELFDAATIARLAGHFDRLLERVLEDPAAPLAQIPWWSAGERGEILARWEERALPESERTAEPAVGGPPRTPTEQWIADLWAELLDRRRVGREENFFAIGGHSLLAIRVVSRLEEICGVQLPLRVVFQAPTVAALARCLEKAQAGGATPAPPPRPVPRNQPLPLSFAQQQLWVLDRMEGGSAFYNQAAAVVLRGQLGVTALERAFREIVRRHEVLHTVFGLFNDQPVQILRPELMPALPSVDLSRLPSARRRAVEGRLLRGEAHRPFDLEHGPLLRLLLLRRFEEEHVLLVVLHHIVSDGWSVGLLMDELTALYGEQVAGSPVDGPAVAGLPTLAVQYADFAVWQRQHLRGERRIALLDFWRGQLGERRAPLELPTDRPRPARPSHRGARLVLPLEGGVMTELEARCRSVGATLYMWTLTAFQVLLIRLGGQRDLVVGTAVAGRTRVEVETLIGCFVNLLPIPATATEGMAFQTFLERTRETVLAAFGHQELPFDLLMAELYGGRGPESRPLVEVAFGIQNLPVDLPRLPGLELERLELVEDLARFDLTLWLREEKEGWLASWSYRTDLFDEATVEGFHRRFETLLRSSLAQPEVALEELEVVRGEKEDKAERRASWKRSKSQGLRRARRRGARPTQRDDTLEDRN